VFSSGFALAGDDFQRNWSRSHLEIATQKDLCDTTAIIIIMATGWDIHVGPTNNICDFSVFEDVGCACPVQVTPPSSLEQ